jgi:hypothetical protein
VHILEFRFELPVFISSYPFADVSTTMIVTPGPVIDFLLKNQKISDIRDIDWPKVHELNIILLEIPAFLFSEEANLTFFYELIL